MELASGTSGFAYKEWKGSFYPEKLAAKGMLAYYAERLPAVEINNTFYRMPKSSVLEGWAEQVPEGFTFVLKASRRITHMKRLKEVEDELGYLYGAAAHLGPHRGPILFQLPPFLRMDRERLAGFLATLPDDHRAVLEFRHESWNDDAIHDLLREHGAALCLADSGDLSPDALIATSPLGYLRLRGADYDDAALEGWGSAVRAQPFERAFVFFKHEDEGAGPALATRFQALFDARQPRRSAPARPAVSGGRA